MRTICLVTCVILAASISAYGQEKLPRMTLLHYDNSAAYLMYGLDFLDVQAIAYGHSGELPSDCDYRFGQFHSQRLPGQQIQRAYIVVGVYYAGGPIGQFVFKSLDAGKIFAKCKENDLLVFQGKFRVVQVRSSEPGGYLMRVVEGVDNNSTLMPSSK